MQFLKFIVIFMAILIVAGLAIIGFTIFNNIDSLDKNYKSNYHFQTCKYTGEAQEFDEGAAIQCTNSGPSALSELYQDGWRLINVVPVENSDIATTHLQFFLEKRRKK